jgi:uncharacterized membrane protein
MHLMTSIKSNIIFNSARKAMKNKTLMNSAIATAITLAAISGSAAIAADQPSANEKCYGIVKAGKNDCAAGPGTSCAGTSAKDGQANAWMYVPKGTCEKIVGGSLTPPAK